LSGLQHLNPQKYVKPQDVLYSSNKNYLRKDDSAKSGSNSAHHTSSTNSTKLLSDNYNASFQHYIQNLSPTASIDYTLWKAVKRIKYIPLSSPHFKQLKARTNIAKAHSFANHLASVFQPHPTNLPDEKEALVHLLESPYQLDPLPLH
jgi:hypothetical protein